MTSRTLTPRALSVMEDYLHLPFPNKNVSCPYYNNKRGSVRAGLRVLVGKGTAHEIAEEIKLISMKEKIDLSHMSDEGLTKMLVEHKIGIDCSGLAYQILNAESISESFGPLKSHLKFPYAKNIVRRLLSRMRPIENTGVRSFAHENNSREIEFARAQPGDYIVLLCTGKEKTYNHILVIYQTDYEEEILKAIHYVHSFAWPTDGRYAHGVRKGAITITDPVNPLADQLWTEQGKTGKENFTHEKAREAMYVSLRRLNWF
ncbi:MAG: hypothetical protein ABI430_01990 [Candidatus Taylorbacteria bacterium]